MSSKDSQDRHFSRRLKAAVEGLHLPSEEELLRGMSFFRGDLGEDIREYAERLWRRVRKRGDHALEPLAAALEELTVEQSDVRMAGRALAWAVTACSLAQKRPRSTIFTPRADAVAHAARLRARFRGAIKRASKRREPEPEESLAIDDLDATAEDETPDVVDRDGSVIVFRPLQDRQSRLCDPQIR